MNNYLAFIKDLEKLISIRSVKGERTPTAPFGEEIKLCLDTFLSIASSMGFDVINYNNHIGEVVFGNGKEVGIIGHLDVVPEGTGWNTDPYKLTLKDKTYYGRGLCDDKAPLLLCLYALKELKDSGLTVNKKFRLFAGCDEESGWGDVAYFNTIATFPEYGFSPDGNFPVSYAEKGMAEITFKLKAPTIMAGFIGGTVVNAVCAHAECKYLGKDINDIYSILEEHDLSKNGNVIISKGISAHGSTPHLGKNAILPLFKAVCKVEKNADFERAIEYLFFDKEKVSEIHSEQGHVTLSPNLLYQKNDCVYLTCDCRFPYPITISDLTPIFDKFNLEYTIKLRHGTQYVKKEGWLVDTLLKSYNKETGEKGSAISQSGSTFARAFKNGCAFGPEFVGEKSSIHEANEHVSEENLLKLYKIYKDAIFSLAKLN